MGSRFKIGEWRIDLQSGHMSSGDRQSRIKPMLLRVLIFLAENAGQVVSKNQLIDEVWGGVHVTDDALTHSISELRKAFDDNARKPHIIATIPKRGYRLIAPVTHETINENLGGRYFRYIVLPFEILSDNSSIHRFANAMTDLLTTQMAKCRQCRVISNRSITAQERVTAKALQEIHVDRILEGTILQTESSIAVTARLFNLRYEYLWAEVYELSSKNGFGLSAQLQLARKIVEAVVKSAAHETQGTAGELP